MMAVAAQYYVEQSYDSSSLYASREQVPDLDLVGLVV